MVALANTKSDVAILAGVRTPFAKAGGPFKDGVNDIA
jgi:hypothetical protein